MGTLRLERRGTGPSASASGATLYVVVSLCTIIPSDLGAEVSLGAPCEPEHHCAMLAIGELLCVHQRSWTMEPSARHIASSDLAESISSRFNPLLAHLCVLTITVVSFPGPI